MAEAAAQIMMLAGAGLKQLISLGMTEPAMAQGNLAIGEGQGLMDLMAVTTLVDFLVTLGTVE